MQLTRAEYVNPAKTALLARAAGASNKLIGRTGMVYGVPGVPGGVQITQGGNVRLGNLPAELADYINTPGTPGSSTFYMYGMDDKALGYIGQDEESVDDVSPSTSPSFVQSVQSIFGQAADAAKTIIPAVLQAQNAKAAQDALRSGQITPYQYQQITSQPAATFALAPSAGLATGLKIGGGTIALLGAGLLAFLFLKKR